MEGSLEYFVVVGKLIVHFGLPVHLAHLHCPRIDGIDDLAVDSTRGALLHFGQIELRFS